MLLLSFTQALGGLVSPQLLARQRLVDAGYCSVAAGRMLFGRTTSEDAGAGKASF